MWFDFHTFQIAQNDLNQCPTNIDTLQAVMVCELRGFPINIIPVFCSWKSNAIWYRANYMESILWEKAVESHFQLPSDAWSAFSSMFIFETKDNKQLRHFTSRFLREPAILTILDHLRNPLRSLRPLLATTSSGSQPTIPLPGEKKKGEKSMCVYVCVWVWWISSCLVFSISILPGHVLTWHK